MANKHFILKKNFKLWGHFKIFNITFFFLDESAKNTI